MSRVLIIGDTHLPFVHVNYLKFLERVRDQFQPDQVVHIGDFVDQHALSRWGADPDGMSNGDEWKATIKEAKRFYKAFPEVTWIVGNHDSRLYKKAFDAGIPKDMLKMPEEIYQAPAGWQTVPFADIDGVRYIHGENSGGASGWQNADLKHGKSIVFGHNHSVAGVRYHRTPMGQSFSLGVGCGIDEDAYAFAYGKASPVRPVLGCGLVVDGTEANFVPFDFSDRSLRRKKREII